MSTSQGKHAFRESLFKTGLRWCSAANTA